MNVHSIQLLRNVGRRVNRSVTHNYCNRILWLKGLGHKSDMVSLYYRFDLKILAEVGMNIPQNLG